MAIAKGISMIKISLGLVILVVTTSCQKSVKHDLSSDQRQILSKYASISLLGKNQYLYYKSVDSLKKALTPPLTKESFRSFDKDWADIDSSKVNSLSGFKKTLPFSKAELRSWSKQISKYQQRTWYPESFPNRVNFIRDVPDYLSRTDIPPPGQDPVHIHHITVPFVYKGESALLYSHQWGKSSYHYFIKKNNDWRHVQSGAITFY